MKWGSGLNLVLGIWLLFVAPAALGLAGPAIGNSVLFGILTILVALWSLVVAGPNHVPAWINTAFGVWLFISPWVLGYAAQEAALWNSIIVGILMVLFATARMAMPRYPTRPAV
jgi:hypothetical protein